MSYPWTPGVDVPATELDILSESNLKTFQSGEAFAIGDALYEKASDAKVYKTDSDGAESTFKFIGFAKEAATGVDETIVVFTGGVVSSGLSGLTPGSVYFVNATAGAIGTTPGANSYKIGRAISATRLLIEKGTKITSGLISLTGTTTSVITVGFRAQRILIEILDTQTNGNLRASNGWSDINTNECIYVHPNGGATIDSSNAWHHQETDKVHTGIVDTPTQTSFRLNQTKTGIGATVDVKIRYTVFG